MQVKQDMAMTTEWKEGDQDQPGTVQEQQQALEESKKANMSPATEDESTRRKGDMAAILKFAKQADRIMRKRKQCASKNTNSMIQG